MTIKRAWQIVESWNGLTFDDVIHGSKEDYKQAVQLLIKKGKILVMDGAHYSAKTGAKLI